MNKKNHYPTWLVSFEIAKLLKEIDFYDYCYFFYNFNKYDKVENICNITLGCEYVSERDTLLPTWEQVFAWFRARGLHCSIRYLVDLQTYSYYIHDNCNWYKGSGNRDTYEEAREACVEDLIKIFNEKKDR